MIVNSRENAFLWRVPIPYYLSLFPDCHRSHWAFLNLIFFSRFFRNFIGLKHVHCAQTTKFCGLKIGKREVKNV